ncbi:MAG: twin-arginine translocase TatA/TatE family subunit, partial [Candidatus Brocadiia bacterium]
FAHARCFALRACGAYNQPLGEYYQFSPRGSSAMLAFMPGNTEWIVVLIVALLIFGSRLPSVMRSLGRSVHEFKAGLDEGEQALTAASEEEQNEEGSEELAG